MVLLIGTILIITLLGFWPAEGATAKEDVPTIQLNNGYLIPIIGLGTYRMSGPEAYQSVKDAIDAGYRHIDTAYLYNNEREIGKAINEMIDAGKVKREDLFIVTKVWNNYFGKDRAIRSVKRSLRLLKSDYIDLVLIHHPFSSIDYLDTWKGLEQTVKDGLVLSIGVSNFNVTQLDRLIKNSKIKPTVNQVESHPHLTQKKLIKFANDSDVAITAYAPLGGGARVGSGLLNDPTIKNIGKKYKKTPAQIMIRYQIDRGVIAIPKSSKKSRIIENFDVFDFKLSQEDMQKIDALNIDHSYYFGG